VDERHVEELHDHGKIRHDFKNMPELRENGYPTGKCPVLADVLPGVPGKSSAGRDHHQSLPEMRPELYFFFRRPAMAEILSGMPGRAYITDTKTNRRSLGWILIICCCFSAFGRIPTTR
jgi:hypothetical protein